MKIRHIFTFVLLLVVVSAMIVGCKTHKKTTEDYGNNSITITSQDFMKKGNELLDQKNYKAALSQFNKAIELDPSNGEAFAYRGMCKYHLEDFKGAIEDYNAAIAILPDYGEVYDLRGIAKGELKDSTGACEDWYKSYELGFNKAYELIEKYCIDDKTINKQ